MAIPSLGCFARSGGVPLAVRSLSERAIPADARYRREGSLAVGAGWTLYYDEGTTALTLSEINALPGAAANISANPLLDSTGHIAAASPCRNAGTATGAPATDRDGDSRPQEGAFDIGADELVP